MKYQKYSQLFGKTNKTSKEYEALNATLLIKAGFIDQVMAGVYSYLPLAKRVLDKVQRIVRDEMDTVASELLLTSLGPVETWQQTKRFDSVDVLMKAVAANKVSAKRSNAEFVINYSHEEMVTPLVQKHNFSYKQLPVGVYQIQTKVRNEPRPKSGLMRGREFLMKDAYSFHADDADFLEYYEEMKRVYMRIYERLGLGGGQTVIALASGGDFTDKYSHEFQTICDTGEDTLFKVPGSDVIYNQEVAPAKAPSFKGNPNEKPAEREDVLGEGIIGVHDLAKFLGIAVEKTTKTIIFEADGGKRVLAAAVRGDYDVNELKLKDAANTTDLRLASAETVKKVTGAEVGYAGILDLPSEVEVYLDESVGGRLNFETGANKIDYHSINVNFGRDLPEPEQFYDIKTAKPGDLDPESGEVYEVLSASEVGNIFPLETKFSDAFGYKYSDEHGKTQQVVMGCYGIGVSRAIGVVAELKNDDMGLVWPTAIAPFQVHIVSIAKKTDDKAYKQAEKLADMLAAEGVEVLWDDRIDAAVGSKLADADLIGIPLRLVVSERSLKQGGVESKLRNSEQVEILDFAAAISKAKELVQQI